ncbi:MAG: 23S rRNA (pseudouridine(1915)-N(3))-methyltransferase RlmH [Proteobacteria bacterium]|nr:23S rRNA (pseudouridine(1915)-N(3))-methyltransferase RlmH [Pseudomonadota bacterium]
MFTKIVFLHFGKFRSKEYSSIFEDYLDRIKHYTKVELKEMKVERDEPEFFNKIKDKIIIALKGTTVLAFSERGKLPSSVEFSNFIENGSGVLSVVVGSSWGLPDFVETKANYLLSVGRLTLPHEAVRVLSAIL